MSGVAPLTTTFNAVLQAIRTWDNVQIDSRPKTVVRAGGVAYIESTTDFPYSEIKSISDTGALEQIIDGVIAGNPKQVEQYKSGKTTVINFLVGQAMKATRGQANVAVVTDLLKQKLG